jgi:micrococcal nuclease
VSTHLRRKASHWGAFFALWLVLGPGLAGAETVLVGEVVDGDSLRLVDGRKIRLTGVNAPELGWGERADQPLAREARGALRTFVGNQPVDLRFGPDRFDHHGRTLAYVSAANGNSAGEYLLRKGLAAMVAIPPNISHVGRYQRAERDARAARRGIWAEPYYQPVLARRLTAADTGFRFVRGTVTRVGKSRKYVYLDLSPRFAIVVSRDNWHYFDSEPEKFVGKRLIVRGWISQWRDKLRVRIGHPSMVELLQ